jgi:folate-binding Fe-S cluster repair protein YgfZ
MQKQSARRHAEITRFALNSGQSTQPCHLPKQQREPMYPLHSLAPIRFTGPDAQSFLQGQLSNDLVALTPEHSQLACCNSAQGRVQAVLRLIQRDDAIMALLPRVMVSHHRPPGSTIACQGCA